MELLQKCAERKRFLFSAFPCKKENKRPAPCLNSKKTQQKDSSGILQDGGPPIDLTGKLEIGCCQLIYQMPTCTSPYTFHLPKMYLFCGESPTISIVKSTVQDIDCPQNLYKDPIASDSVLERERIESSPISQ